MSLLLYFVFAALHSPWQFVAIVTLVYFRCILHFYFSISCLGPQSFVNEIGDIFLILAQIISCLSHSI